MNSQNLEQLIHKHRLLEARKVFKAYIFFSPIFLVFAVSDYMQYPEHFVFFISMRLAFMTLPIISYLLVKKTDKFKITENLVVFNALAASTIITIMIFTRGGLDTDYFYGLNLIGLVALTFFILRDFNFFLVALVIYAPYFLKAAQQLDSNFKVSQIIFQSIVAITTIGCSYLVHLFREKYRIQNLTANLRLSEELEKRNEIISTKTNEAVRLTRLATQFSPQVIDSIQKGQLSLDYSGQRTEVCALFVDVVNSTERVNKINQKKFEKAISYFMDNAAECLIKHNITIVQFMGDGLICLSNAPNKSSDFNQRMAHATLDILNHVQTSQDFYEPIWQKPFQVRMGLASGFANVGFFGNEKYFKSFTAIGPVMNLSARLCSVAEPNHILVDSEVYDALKDEFNLEFAGKRELKGFNDEIIYTYNLNSRSAEFSDRAG